VPENPWAGFDDMVTQSAPAPLPLPPPPPAEKADQPETPLRGTPSQRSHKPPPESRPSLSQQGPSVLIRIGFFVLLPYALLMTVLAVYGLFFKTSRLDAGHPLSTIPDNFGEFPAAERKKVGKYSFPVDGPLPADQKVTLGDKLAIGSLEIEPVRVQARNLKVIQTAKIGVERTERNVGQAVVLSLKIRNSSSDLNLYPMDPAFTRKAGSNDRPATGLVVGNQTFWGGAIEWPLTNAHMKRKYEEAQETDANPLKPGESREYVVFTDANGNIVRAVRNGEGPLMWRVQLRHGLVHYRGHDVPVTAIIGVEFKPEDVKVVE